MNSKQKIGSLQSTIELRRQILDKKHGRYRSPEPPPEESQPRSDEPEDLQPGESETMERLLSGKMSGLVDSITSEIESNGLPAPVVMLKQIFQVAQEVRGIEKEKPATQPPARKVDPSVESLAHANQAFIDAARNRLDKRRAEMRLRAQVSELGPLGESRSADLIKRVEMVPLASIAEDAHFDNFRLEADEPELEMLIESMRHEGLKVPIIVIESSEPGIFHVRAGFRRTLAAQRLNWKAIPAVILPRDTPEVEEYWTNIIENSSREKLSSYELAHAAKVMRDTFKVTPRDFALKAGYSESHIANLLRCIDNLPDEIQMHWKNRVPIPLTVYFELAKLSPEEAMTNFRPHLRLKPRSSKGWLPPLPDKERHNPLTMATSTGLKRMQKLREALESAKKLDNQTRTLSMKIVDFCSGATNSVPGIFDVSTKEKLTDDDKRRLRELKLPEFTGGEDEILSPEDNEQ